MFETALIVATLLCGLVAGFLFGFSVVAMPGLRTLPEREYLEAFKRMDRVIQDNQPVFMLVWVGSVIGMIVTLVLGFGELDGQGLGMVVAAAAIYLVGAQLPTGVVNIPLNNRVQGTDLANASADEVAGLYADFEPRWNRWNVIRTLNSTIAVALLLVTLARL